MQLRETERSATYNNPSRLSERLLKEGQDNKGVWWMPRRQESKKDVVNDDMLRGAVSKH